MADVKTNLVFVVYKQVQDEPNNLLRQITVFATLDLGLAKSEVLRLEAEAVVTNWVSGHPPTYIIESMLLDDPLA